jgi:formate--tetrahydrofolate ligase
VVVAINSRPEDHPSEHAAIRAIADELGVRCAVTSNHADGGEGAVELAEAVTEAAEGPKDFRFLYQESAPLQEKVEAVATRIYGAARVVYEAGSDKQLRQCERDGFGDLPVCIAKTQFSLSSDPKLKGAPTGWVMPIREVKASAGAGFVYLISGEMRTMPALTSHPAAENVDLDEAGEIVGLF